jgi:Tol biopolymer transport system component
MRKKRGLIIGSSLLIACLLLSSVAYQWIERRTREVANSNWSVHGEWIVFSCAPRGGSRSRLYLVRPDGSELTRLTTDEIVAVSPSWSPDGDEIVFEVVPYRLFRLRRGFDKLVPLNISKDRHGRFPTWSPDGQRIAFISLQPDGGNMLMLMNMDGSVQSLVVGNVTEDPISWSPDGQWIAYTRGNAAAARVSKIKIDGSEEHNITDFYFTDPAWSPDGNLIAFRNLSDGNIYVAQEDGSEITRLTDLPTAAYNPAWSPDGQWIVFGSGFEHADLQLFKIRTDGRELQQIVDMNCKAVYPDWKKMPGD